MVNLKKNFHAWFSGVLFILNVGKPLLFVAT